MSDEYSYQIGFDNEFESEALPGALPQGQNSPQVAPFGLYAEQLSGTAFTRPRGKNFRSWLYRIRPTVCHSPFEPYTQAKWLSTFPHALPHQMRWAPPAVPPSSTPVDFIDGIVSYAGAGHPSTKTGVAIHYYLANCSMDKKAFYNSDGDFLIVPQLGTLNIQTELGFLKVAPREICVIPRGIRFSVALEGEEARGYILELYQGRFELPSLGPIGANGLANPRDFLYPVAAYVDDEETYSIVTKFNGSFFVAESDHSPFDVVAWHGNYAPYKYDLDKFCCMNSVTYDHPDPSIYTVLTAPSAEVGTAVCDFVIFPPRWMVMEHSFRPPYYHRNCMSEFMGMIYGKYDAKEGFVAGGSSLHSCMTPHGPDSDTFFKASTDPLDPTKFEGGLAFMFESTYMFNMSDEAVNAPGRETTYNECWSNLPRLFDPSNRDVQVTLPGEEEKEG